MKQMTGRQTIWLSCVLLLGVTLSGWAQTGRRPIEYDLTQARPLVASVESFNGQYLLNLTNNTPREFRGTAQLRLGNDGIQQEAGKVAIVIAPNNTRLLLLQPFALRGEQYTLQIFDQREVLVFYKIAPIRALSQVELTQAEAVQLTLDPAAANHAAAPPKSAVALSPTPIQPSEPAPAPRASTPEVYVKPHIVAGAQASDPMLLAFELSATKPISGATLAVVINSKTLQKPVSLTQHALVEFSLPGELGDGQLRYVLKRKDGTVIVEEKINIETLFLEDVVAVDDVRPDRVGYLPGETARITLALQGTPKQGYKLLLSARDANGNVFFNQTLYGMAGEAAGEQTVPITLPLDLKERFTLEFKLFDAVSNSLFDSGERDFTVSEKH